MRRIQVGGARLTLQDRNILAGQDFVKAFAVGIADLDMDMRARIILRQQIAVARFPRQQSAIAEPQIGKCAQPVRVKHGGCVRRKARPNFAAPDNLHGAGRIRIRPLVQLLSIRDAGQDITHAHHLLFLLGLSPMELAELCRHNVMRMCPYIRSYRCCPQLTHQMLFSPVARACLSRKISQAKLSNCTPCFAIGVA